MTLLAGRTHALTDRAGRDLGRFEVESVQGNLVLGTFVPGPGFAEVEPLFRYFEELVDHQVLSLTDQAQVPIGELGIRFADGPHLTDVQIYSDGGASGRLPAGRNGPPT